MSRRSSRLARAFYKLDREKLLKEQKYKCFYCGKPLTVKTATMDHVIPKSKTKYHSTQNCVVSCAQCNGAKGNKPISKMPQLEEWEKQLIEGLAKLEERTKKAEFVLSFDQKGGYNKWKRYWIKRNRWQH